MTTQNLGNQRLTGQASTKTNRKYLFVAGEKACARKAYTFHRSQRRGTAIPTQAPSFLISASGFLDRPMSLAIAASAATI
jgi:hypothetical protein